MGGWVGLLSARVVIAWCFLGGGSKRRVLKREVIVWVLEEKKVRRRFGDSCSTCTGSVGKQRYVQRSAGGGWVGGCLLLSVHVLGCVCARRKEMKWINQSLICALPYHTASPSPKYVALEKEEGRRVGCRVEGSHVRVLASVFLRGSVSKCPLCWTFGKE